MRLSRQTKVDLLKPIPLFAGCSRTGLETVSRVTDEIRIPASQALMRHGSPGPSIYGHYDLSDLERAMEALARSRREDEEPAD